MALNDTKVPSAASDVVAILDSNFNQVIQTARPIKAYVNPPSKPMQHPMEDGSIRTDNIIFLPVELELSVILPPGEFRALYAQIEQLYRTAPLLIVQTKTATYKNMIFVGTPHEEGAEMFDAVAMILKMQEVQLIRPQAGTLPASSVKNAPDQSTVDTGSKQPGNDFTITSKRYGTPKQLAQFSGGFDSGESVPFAPPPATGPGYVSDADIVQPGQAVTTVFGPSNRTEGGSGSALPEVAVSDRSNPPLTASQVNDIANAAIAPVQ